MLAAMCGLPAALAYRSHHHSVTLLPRRLIDVSVVRGVWKRLVFGHPERSDGLVDRNSYVFCVLEAFHRHLRRREIYAPASSRWRDPNAALLDGRGGPDARATTGGTTAAGSSGNKLISHGFSRSP